MSGAPSRTHAICYLALQEAKLAEQARLAALPKLELQTVVEARHGGGVEWYAGKIVRIRTNGSYDIKYEDGDKEQKVKRDFIRLPGIKGPDELAQGMPVEVKEGETYKNATVVKVRVYERGGKRLVMYDVVYEESGTKEKKVERDRIRLSATSDVAAEIFKKEQEQVEEMKRMMAEKQKEARRLEEPEEAEEVEAWRANEQGSAEGKFVKAIILRVRQVVGKETKYDVLYVKKGDQKKKLNRDEIRSAAQLLHRDHEDVSEEGLIAEALGF
jgi:hypothetical protein